jgi:SAM-dependent methyltransferase
MTVDFGRTASDYGAYRAGFPGEFFSRVRAMGAGLAGQRVVDLGTGTGVVARGFARAGCVVTGIDPAPTLLREAQRLDAEATVEVSYRIGRAEDTGLEAGSWDVVAAGNCWHWFDRPRAAAEARRLLVPGGALLMCHLSYLALPGNVCSVADALILERNPAWSKVGETGIYPAWTVDAAGAGFVGLETFSFDLIIPYSHQAWRGRMRTSSGVGASLPDPVVADFDAALAHVLAERFPSEPLAIPHRVWALIARAPAT